MSLLVSSNFMRADRQDQRSSGGRVLRSHLM